MITKETKDILRLIRSQNVGPKNFYNLIKFFGSAGKALEKLPKLSVKGGRSRPIEIFSEKKMAKEIEDTYNYGAKFVIYKDKIYPNLLKHISDPPPILTILGREDLMKNDILAIVGARNASASSCYFTEKIARELGNSGLTIVSGLAKGIDSFAHKATIKTGTIAVIAGGINNIYPAENEDLYHEIAEEGCIIAENGFGIIAKSQNFPQRNRIISGISLGTLVVEATSLSGSLITARFAAEQGREVFAIPASPLDPRASGNNKLLKEGAKLVTCMEDILEEIKNKTSNLKELDYDNNFDMKEIDLDDRELEIMRKRLLDNLDNVPISIEYLVKTTSIPYNIILLLIIELELADRIERHAGNKISLCYKDINVI